MVPRCPARRGPAVSKHVRFLPDNTRLTSDNVGMDLTLEESHEAARSRDLKYDGRFFTGVITTGCYCRQGCGGMPKPENVLFFACAAAAQAAGFRPCKRCRPETSAGTPAWLAAAEAVSRALRLIGEGALDDGDGMEELATRVGLSSR